MKPTKKKTAKKRDPRDPILSKLLDLKYRINDAYRENRLPEDMTKGDKLWVMGQISALREGARLDTHQMEKANKLWKEYSPSRMNNWESSREV